MSLVVSPYRNPKMDATFAKPVRLARPIHLLSPLAVLGLIGYLYGLPAMADEVLLPIAENVRQGQQQSLPVKGTSMAAVESGFGEPQQRTAAVGTPPISQWHYPAFTVYFENSHVIHSVAKRKK